MYDSFVVRVQILYILNSINVIFVLKVQHEARARVCCGKLLQVKLFNVTSVLQGKILRVKTVVEHIRNLTKVDILLLNVTVMSHTLQGHFA